MIESYKNDNRAILDIRQMKINKYGNRFSQTKTIK